MPAYRLYVLNDSSHIEGAVIIEAETDPQAIESAISALDGRSGELWLADEKVCVLNAAN